MLQQWCEALRVYLKFWFLYQKLLFSYSCNVQVYLFDGISVTVQLYKNSEFYVQLMKYECFNVNAGNIESLFFY